MATLLTKNQFIQMASAMSVGPVMSNVKMYHNAVETAVRTAEELWDELEERGYNKEEKRENSDA